MQYTQKTRGVWRKPGITFHLPSTFLPAPRLSTTTKGASICPEYYGSERVMYRCVNSNDYRLQCTRSKRIPFLTSSHPIFYILLYPNETGSELSLDQTKKNVVNVFLFVNIPYTYIVCQVQNTHTVHSSSSTVAIIIHMLEVWWHPVNVVNLL